MSHRSFCCLTFSLLTLFLSSTASFSLAAPPRVETMIRPTLSGDEFSRQPDIWATEVHFKSMRMIWVNVPDPKTNKVTRELIWYLPYRIVNRRVEGAKNPKGTFLPEFELVTEDNNHQTAYIDEVIPAAQAAINKREKREYKNSVEIVGELPELTESKAKLEHSLYGVATWRGIDPKTDYFKVFMTGFSNGYQQVEIDGSNQILRRTIVQRYSRPGDELDQREREIRQVGQPTWIYRPTQAEKAD